MKNQGPLFSRHLYGYCMVKECYQIFHIMYRWIVYIGKSRKLF